jgi:hypothetical protein
MIKRVMRVIAFTPPRVTLGEIALSDSEKAEVLSDSIEAQFQPVTDPSDPAVIEMVDVALRAYSYAPVSEPMLSNPVKVKDAVRGLEVSKAPDPGRIPNGGFTKVLAPCRIHLVAIM